MVGSLVFPIRIGGEWVWRSFLAHLCPSQFMHGLISILLISPPQFTSPFSHPVSDAMYIPYYCTEAYRVPRFPTIDHPQSVPTPNHVTTPSIADTKHTIRTLLHDGKEFQDITLNLKLNKRTSKRYRKTHRARTFSITPVAPFEAHLKRFPPPSTTE